VTVHVERVTVADPEVLSAVRHLLPQLSETAAAPDAYDVETVVTSQVTTLLVARDDDHRIVGMLTVAIFRLSTGLRAWIEDVVVDQAARGLGAGKALMEHALRLAEEAGARSVDLTSRPSREEARALYLSMGFEERHSTLYRHDLGS
jgi:ribosomal protein S18 acetylase RimI-like enzyme